MDMTINEDGTGLLSGATELILSEPSKTVIREIKIDDVPYSMAFAPVLIGVIWRNAVTDRPS